MDEDESVKEASPDDNAQKALAESRKTNQLLGIIGGAIGLVIAFSALSNLSH